MHVLAVLFGGKLTGDARIAQRSVVLASVASTLNAMRVNSTVSIMERITTCSHLLRHLLLPQVLQLFASLLHIEKLFSLELIVSLSSASVIDKF